MSLDREGLVRAVAKHGPVARVVVADAKGSVPREPGAAMIVWAGGQDGTIGGGALEFEAAAAARRLLGAERGVQVTRHALGPGLGQCCGGAVTLVTETFTAASLAVLPGDIYCRRVAGAAEMPLAVRRFLARMRNGQGPARPLLTGGWFAEPVAPARVPLWIWGAGHVGRALVSVIAFLPEFAITWVDVAADRFPETPAEGVTIRIAASPADLVAEAPAAACHLILTYSHALDLEICHRLLAHGFAGAGLIGSASKWARFRARLGQLGHTDAQIARICCPIGRPSLGKHPQAIAVGVAAALLSDKASEMAARDAAG